MKKISIRQPIIILLFIPFILAFFLLTFLNIIYNEKNEIISWTIRSNPSKGDDYAYAIYEIGNYVYVIGVGMSIGDNEFRIEKRHKIHGELISAWTYNPSLNGNKCQDCAIYDCVIVDDKIYVVGYDKMPGNAEWIILALDLNLNLLAYTISNPSSGSDTAFAISSDGKYLYIVGYEEANAPLDCMWRIEKRTLCNLSLVDIYSSNPSELEDIAYNVGINPTTGDIWVIGFDWMDEKQRWRVEILNRDDLNLIKIIRLEISPLFIFEGPFSISFDNKGNAIIVGSGGIVKVNENGDIIALNSGYYQYYKTLYFNGNVYVVGKEYERLFSMPIQRWFWFLYIYDSSLNLVNKITLGTTDALFSLGKLSIDSSNIYVAGSVKTYQEFDLEWIIYSFNSSNILVPTTKFSIPRYILEILEILAGCFLGVTAGILSATISSLKIIAGSAISALLAHFIKLRTPLPEGIPLGFIALLISLWFFGSQEKRRIAYFGGLVGSFMFIGTNDAKLIEGAVIGAIIALLLKRFFKIFEGMKKWEYIFMKKKAFPIVYLAIVIVIVMTEKALSNYLGNLFVHLLTYSSRHFTICFFIGLLIGLMKNK